MGRVISALLLSLTVLFAFSLTAQAVQSEAGQTGDMGMDEGMDMDEGMMGPMTSAPGAPGRMCGPGCSCDKCKMGMKKGGMMGLHGDVGMMTMPGMNRSCRTPEFYLMHKDDLGLSPYQVEALDKLYVSLKKGMITKGAAVMVLELDLGAIVTKADFKLTDAQGKLTEIEKARTELRMTVLKASADARDLLSPEQLEKLKELNLSLLTAGRCGPMSKAPAQGAMKEMMMEKMRRNMAQ